MCLLMLMSFLSLLKLNGEQARKLSDIAADMGQVFLASIFLPSFGFGGSPNIWNFTAGALLMILSFLFALFYPRYYHGFHDS